MRIFKGQGKPARSMQVQIGDIYIDDTTSKKYECTFAYKDVSDIFDVTWKEIDSNVERLVEQSYPNLKEGGFRHSVNLMDETKVVSVKPEEKPKTEPKNSRGEDLEKPKDKEEKPKHNEVKTEDKKDHKSDSPKNHNNHVEYNKMHNHNKK